MAIAFDSHGSGPPLVLLHGIGSRRAVWDPVVPALARERRVIAVDIPGFGDSPPNGTAPTAGGFAACLDDWFAEQGLGRPHVAGNSMGGAIALALAQSAAGRATLCAQTFGRPWRLSPAEAVATIDAFVAAPSFDAAMAAFADYTFRGADDARGTPVTVAWGTRDALLLPRQARRAERMMPWARHVALPGCGHVPFHDDPEGVVAVILAASA
jgi:pimeloyl-ACP methyl ester carboxylesterase